jgi:hypothetical protein
VSRWDLVTPLILLTLMAVLGAIVGAWAAAVTDGWVDLAELTMLDRRYRPDCGAAGCRALTRWVDPSGVGWCLRHSDAGLHGVPPFPKTRP